MDATMALLAAALVLFAGAAAGAAGQNYTDALSKSILYFEAQRSGRLPATQRVAWRGDSALNDGKDSGVDLVGGYYDAGDNVKFGFPMAFTVTMLAWSVVEYGEQLSAAGELRHAMDAVKWGTDYFIKAHTAADLLYGEVGDGDSDHACWQRPEDMTTPRGAYRIDDGHPGSDLAAETAAALAAASVVFRKSDPAYAAKLIRHAKQLFSFADAHRGKYDASITVARGFYPSSGFNDELLWAAAWLFAATADRKYIGYMSANADALGGATWANTEFGWDVKYAGAQVLAAKFLLRGEAGTAAAAMGRYQQRAEDFLCSVIGRGPQNVPRTPAGLLYKTQWNNLQFVTGASFLLAVYSDVLSAAGGNKTARCSNGAAASAAELLAFAKAQVDYILGDNPARRSYLVGYSGNYPQQVHHHGASIPSVKVHPEFVSCGGGYSDWYSRNAPNPNVLAGAVVGGPDGNDGFSDVRSNYQQNEAATYNTAPLVGVLARLRSDASRSRSAAGVLQQRVAVDGSYLAQ